MSAVLDPPAVQPAGSPEPLPEHTHVVNYLNVD